MVARRTSIGGISRTRSRVARSQSISKHPFGVVAGDLGIVEEDQACVPVDGDARSAQIVTADQRMLPIDDHPLGVGVRKLAHKRLGVELRVLQRLE